MFPNMALPWQEHRAAYSSAEAAASSDMVCTCQDGNAVQADVVPHRPALQPVGYHVVQLQLTIHRSCKS